MDEVKKFLNILRRYRMTLVVVPMVIVVITFFLVKNLPDSYFSQVQIETGIVDATKQFHRQSLFSVEALQGDQINQEFDNLIAMMQMKKVIDQVSYQLMIHDLTSDKPFREPSKLLRSLNPSARKHALEVYTGFHKKMQPLNLWNSDQNGINEVIRSMNYDYESLLKKLSIYRSGVSDYIIVQFESEDPVLSAFVVNTLATEFVSFYSATVRNTKVQTTSFLRTLLNEKSDTLSKKMADLRNYKIRNRVLNLSEQSKQLYSSILEYETKKQEVIQSTSSYAGALNEIDQKFSPDERKYIEASTSRINQSIVALKSELSSAYDQYYKNEFDENYKQVIDSLQLALTSQINKASDQYILNPLAAKEDLVNQKTDLEIKLDISRYGLNSLESELNRLNERFNELVPREAEVQAYEMEIDIATKEYLDVINRYNQSSLESSIPIKINVVQAGMPGLAQPSKKMLLVILSGIISVIFILVILFIFFLLDKSIISAAELADKTQFPVLGHLSDIPVSALSLSGIWHDQAQQDLNGFKNQVRQVRFEVSNEMVGKILVVTSLCFKEGKSFITMHLSAAFMIISKRILVIDGNFLNSSVSNTYSSDVYFEDYLTQKISVNPPAEPGITILKNKGGDSSLLELTDETVIQAKLNDLRKQFDLILIDSASLEKSSQVKEWIQWADDVVGVFSFGNSIQKHQKDHLSYFRETEKFRGWILNRYQANS